MTKIITVPTEGATNSVHDADDDDGQSKVDRALAAFIAQHNLDINIYCF